MQYPRRENIPLFEGYCRKDAIDGKEIQARIGGSPLKLKVASSNSTKEKGFMNSGEPSENEGIIFIYDIEDILRFWMKNVDFPLDIMFFDSKLNLVGHTTMDPQNGEPDQNMKVYSSEKPARYAVEVRSGWCDKNLKPESKLEF